MLCLFFHILVCLNVEVMQFLFSICIFFLKNLRSAYFPVQEVKNINQTFKAVTLLIIITDKLLFVCVYLNFIRFVSLWQRGIGSRQAVTKCQSLSLTQ